MQQKQLKTVTILALARKKTYSEKARALEITLEAEKVRCDAQTANSEAKKF